MTGGRRLSLDSGEECRDLLSRRRLRLDTSHSGSGAAPELGVTPKLETHRRDTAHDEREDCSDGPPRANGGPQLRQQLRGGAPAGQYMQDDLRR